ncbi:MAG: putative Ig domain-containing protein, partial [Magnetococcales bacterium]|nr:putative Ig domain-containing protein [Magnetococcales bacterium]MBF0116967.1 putative Ig domain-containing protein [Magnetococcales bacterium]
MLTVRNYFLDSAHKIEQVLFDDGTVWTTDELDATPISPTMAGFLYGSTGNDVIDLRAPFATTTLGPGGISHTFGNDTYLFGVGAGQDTINEYDWSNNTDTIRFMDLSPSEVSFSRGINASNATKDLVFTINGTTDSLTVVSFFSGARDKVERVVFEDGTTWDLAELDAAPLRPVTEGVLNVTQGDDMVDLRNPVCTSVMGEYGFPDNMGNDTYLFGVGAGQDIIRDFDHTTGNIDTVQMVGVLPSEVILSRVIHGQDLTSDLLIEIKSVSDTLTVTGGLSLYYNRVEEIVFDDGTLWNWAAIELAAALPTTAGPLNATSGDDRIDLRNAVATQISGAYSGGNDTYLFGTGAGQDTITDNDGTSGNRDTIRVIGKTSAEVSVSRGIRDGSTSNDLLLTIQGSADTLTVKDYFASAANKIEQILFDDGTLWTVSQLATAPIVPTTAGTLYATSGNDVIDLSNGVSTTIVGFSNTGNDLYLFGMGSGQDAITDYDTIVGNMDTVRMVGILPSQVTLSRTVNGNIASNDLVLSVNGTSDTLTLTNYLLGSANQIERIEFANGTMWGSAELNVALPLLPTGPTLYTSAGSDVVDFRNPVSTTTYGPNGTSYTLGNDTYLFGVGAGQDFINEYDPNAGNSDTVQIIGKLPSEVTLSRSINGTNAGIDLVFSLNGSTDKLTVVSYFFNSNSNKIERVLFDNGQLWTAAELNAAPFLPIISGTLNTTDKNDIVDLRNAVSSSILGLNGSSSLGNDTYLFGVGSGQDSIRDFDYTTGNIDTVRMIGLLPSEVTISRVIHGQNLINDLLIEIKGTTDTLTITDNFSLASSRIEQIVFDDGTLWNWATIELAAGLPTTAGPLNATSGDDRIDLRNAVATQISSTYSRGNDTYLFGVGSGQDTITDNDSTTGKLDTIRVIGKQPSEVALSRMGNHLLLTITGSADQLIVQNYFAGNAYKIERVLFDDGTVWGTFQLDNLNVNHAPTVVHPVADMTVMEDASFTATINTNTFVDSDSGDALSVTVVLASGDQLPDWLTFNAVTRTVTGAPANDDVGVIALKVTARDLGGLTVSDFFDLTVNNVNDAPYLLQPLADQVASADTPFRLVLPTNLFGDVDAGDTLTFSASLIDGMSLPSWLTFDSVSHIFYGTPDNTSAGILGVRLTATDQEGDSAKMDFMLDIANHLAGTATANTLLGTALRDLIEGFEGNDTLNGGVGADTLVGGLGNDVYIVDSVYDVVLEMVGEGTDTVQSSVSYRLGANIEKLTLTGISAIDGTGNDLNNALTGNGAANTLSGGMGNDTLNGGAGADTLIGHMGNDIYLVDNLVDRVVESAGEGIDTVQSAVSWVLGNDLENLTLGLLKKPLPQLIFYPEMGTTRRRFL